MSIRIILVLLLILPWLTLFFMKKESIKRFMPVTIFSMLIMSIVFQIAYTYKWWVIYQYVVPWGYLVDVSFAYGIFAVGTLWIFRLTSHRFRLYVLTNLVMDALFAFVVFPLLRILHVATVKNIEYWQYFLVIFGLSFLLYGYHKWQETIFQT